MISKLIEAINMQQNNSDTKGLDDLQENDPYTFTLPITYIENKQSVQESIKTDLELLPTSGKVSLYNNVLNPASKYANKIIPMYSAFYTSDISFLKDTQSLLKNFTHVQTPEPIEIEKVDLILDELSNETGFYEKYRYLDIKILEPLNHFPLFLQLLTLYNLASPIISLAIPILMLIIPFFILKIQKIKVSLSTYISTLLTILKNHVVGKAVSDFAHVGWDRRFFMIISVAFYFINIYQNIASCRTFYQNIYKIRQYLLSINTFLQYSIKSIDNINNHCKSSYLPFIKKNLEIKEDLCKFSNEITVIKLEIVKIKQVTKIGNILGAFYQLFKNAIYKKSIVYSLYLHGYIENISNIQNNIANKTINICKFTKKQCKFKDAYFASLTSAKPIKNTYSLNKNILITGPNAAGKTTLLKTTIFNILLSQQFGLGFYKSANINPYTYIHSYINIPDTSERDSLFQAEARRCKEILDSISNSNTLERHFCIFDEIYSGTNPSEAIASAYSFLKFISNKPNVNFMLTTHYFSLCKMMITEKSAINQQMEILNSKNTYKLIDGISNIKGGIKVLEDLDYDPEIIRSAKEIVDTINI